MAQTVKQFAIFNIPISPNADIKPEDAWLFNEPVKTFDIGTPEETVFHYYNGARKVGTRVIGLGGVATRLILKVRHVHFTNYVKVIGADTVREPIEA